MRHLLTFVVPTVLALLVPVLTAATPPIPTFGTAVVDGQYSEWNLTSDFFADMYRAGNSSKAVESKLYLRYDCVHNTMYALVLVQANVVGFIDAVADDAWVAIDAINAKVVNQESGNDGVPPDFAWVGRAYDGDSSHVQGYEASFYMVPGDYLIIAHIEVLDEGQQTSATDNGFPHTGPELLIPDWPSAVQPSSFGGIKSLYR
ncbi:MAG TPA: hypothetical protein VMU02_03080 [bacterium]|nr:hypothetical protein [bacterium]